ncbi:hypothetical protein [Vibrio sp. CAU 1672]|uniref:hypothetical protein n=1 Tax=Vibrio sp. CAU 1672 TaxID=3032594 RepID=UPI0023DBB0DC|nr:hypothetical protein [Vibrio sp. CAU 1672]MDF2154037.1 hypothetical protein [Vibrio sp. CAU 1672]
MAKRLCKMNRKQIASSLSDIHRLVVAPRYVCRSCARASVSKGSLCKPAAIPPQTCQDKPLAEQQACALLAEAIPAGSTVVSPERSAEKAAVVKRVVARVKEKKRAADVASVSSSVNSETPAMFDLADKKALKKAKKVLKKHYKQQKKLLKLAKKQHKLLKRQRQLEARHASLEALLPTPPTVSAGESLQAKVH